MANFATGNVLKIVPTGYMKYDLVPAQMLIWGDAILIEQINFIFLDVTCINDYLYAESNVDTVRALLYFDLVRYESISPIYLRNT